MSCSDVAGLVKKPKAPCDSACWRLSSRVTTCTGMWRSAGSCLRWLSTVQPGMSGRKTSSDTAVGRYSRASSMTSLPRDVDTTLKPASRASPVSTRA